jgi:hypothetical protein
MKNLKYLVLLLFTVFVTSCEKKLPSTVTIVKVNLVDENNVPLDGYLFKVYGTYNKGLSPIATFREIQKTNKDGLCNFEIQVIKPTKDAFISPTESFLDKRYFIKLTTGEFVSIGGGPIPVGIGRKNEFYFKLKPL